jgi:hypothetical protein
VWGGGDRNGLGDFGVADGGSRRGDADGGLRRVDWPDSDVHHLLAQRHLRADPEVRRGGVPRMGGESATWIQMVVAVAFCWATLTCAAAIRAGHVGGGGGTGMEQVFSSASRASVYC